MLPVKDSVLAAVMAREVMAAVVLPRSFLYLRFTTTFKEPTAGKAWQPIVKRGQDRENHGRERQRKRSTWENYIQSEGMLRASVCQQ